MPKTSKYSDKSMKKRDKSKKHGKTKKSKKHSHKSKRRSSSSDVSSDSSSSSATSIKLLRALEERRLKERLEHKRAKELMKANETPEEKRMRRLKEKQAKEVRRRERMGWDTEYQHYTNQDNPFGDSNLMSTFVWNKKLEKDGLHNVSLDTVELLSRQKQLENKVELEKVKKRRVERELERQAREDENVLQQRSKEAAQFQEWERQEDEFHLEQARLRSVIRIQDGRAKPIDLLAQYISQSKMEDDLEMHMHEPYYLLNGLSIKDLEDLLVDIKVYVALEKGKNSDFWDDMTVIVEDELQKLQKLEAEGDVNVTVGGRREGINKSVVREVSDIFRGKNTTQLFELKCRIEGKIAARSDGVDVSYWESLLSQLKAHMARARLRDRHQENLQQKLHVLKIEAIEQDEQQQLDLPGTSAEALAKASGMEDNAEEAQEIDHAQQALEVCFQLYDEGCYSPQYIAEADVEAGQIFNSEEFNERIERSRVKLQTKAEEQKSLTHEEMRMQQEARKGMLADEAEFSVESVLESPLQMASDKYRPRKPRYFNRVHTGFEWNKYNQTHYDMDNPPPKIVQGYKFNIFYPDLIEKSKTPQYFLVPCEDNPDFAVLRFHAGPPYEDIAFKIVNREWEFSYKRGFRCQFHNNIFQLWFHFKRYRYRR